MAAAGLPLLKLSALLVKTIAKPLASRLKVEAASRPALREFCEKIGNKVHYIYSRMNVVASGYKFVGVKPLAPEVALNDGISTLSETLVVGFSAFVVIVDYSRSATSNAEKAEKAAEDKRRTQEELEARFRALEDRATAMEQRAERRWFQREKERTDEAAKASSSWFWW
jgi:hypothetical protein